MKARLSSALLCLVAACSEDHEGGDRAVDSAFVALVCGFQTDSRAIYRDHEEVRLEVEREEGTYATSGKMTENALDELDDIEDETEPGEYNDCLAADGCVATVALDAGEVRYCMWPVPKQVEHLASFINDLQVSLATCQHSARIQIDSGCEPIPSAAPSP